MTREVAVQMGAARPKNRQRAGQLFAGEGRQLVNICYTVEGAQSVRIDPIGFHAGAKGKGCVNHLPTKTTTYVVSAVGADGDKDQEGSRSKCNKPGSC